MTQTGRKNNTIDIYILCLNINIDMLMLLELE
jgi:hypothetical protein